MVPDARPDGELLREVERVADRVRLVAPRLDVRGTSEAQQQLADIRTVLQQLADLAADAEQRERLAVPVLGPHALSDQVAVLGRDAAGCPEPTVSAAQELLAGLRRRL